MSKPLDFVSRRLTPEVEPTIYTYDSADIYALGMTQVVFTPHMAPTAWSIRMSYTDALWLASALIQAVAGPEEIEPRRAGG